MSKFSLSATHQGREKQWAAFWEEKGYAHSHPHPTKKACTVLMPPPNITGQLHMGHVLNNTIQDILVRKARMEGQEVCWVPGTDHASIATEAKVVAALKKRGITKQSLGRQKFLAEAQNWKVKYEGIILTQLKKLGLSCDWNRLAFTLDEKRSTSVYKTFVKLYEEGYIYRGMRMIHWDPEGQTALADEEVIYREVEGALYAIAYPIVGTNECLTIATTRPETLLGDTAIAVHPEDARYQHLHGKEVMVPLTQRVIPIIADPYVDPTFGSGALKVTPSHDPNDYALGQKHGLPSINIFNPNGTLNENGGIYQGLDRQVARERIVADLQASGALQKVTPHLHKVGFSERTNAVVEPRISTQWFVRMQALAKPALAAIEKEAIRFHPHKFTNTYRLWLENIKDWCISRQLWWGHRIPAYQLPDGSYVVAETKAQAFEKAQAQWKGKALTLDDLRQDPDVLDTWFSSWLWPLSVFDGINQPHNAELNYYYPTAYLVTAPEIIFFWVARMIMAGYYFTQKPPFRDVYFTGIVRDKQRRKMSKSLGNSPDPLLLIDKYGVDGVRAGMLFSSPAGNDLLFDEQLCQQGNQFVHKITNAYRLVTSWSCMDQAPTALEKKATQWLAHRFQMTLHEVEDQFKRFKLSEALMTLYKFIWDDFCAHYLEMIKPQKEKKIPISIYEATTKYFAQTMQLLHPFMPFITEEVWQKLDHKGGYSSIMIAPWPKKEAFDASVLAEAEEAFLILKALRHEKKKLGWRATDAPRLYIQGAQGRGVMAFAPYICRKAELEGIHEKAEGKPTVHAFTVKDQLFWLDGVQLKKEAVDRKKHASDLAKEERFLGNLMQKLANPTFLAKAPPQLIAQEKEKVERVKEQIKALKVLLGL